jgi:glutathione S-transferase
MFAAEVGADLQLEDVDLVGGANRQADYLKINPAGQLPCLEMDNGERIAEVTAICEYLDEVSSGPSLIGATPEERANTRMWTRRVDLNICEPLANGFRYAEGLPMFKDRMITIPEAAEGLKSIAREKLVWLNGLMDDGREFVGGNSISLADVLLYCMLAFGNQVGQPFDESLSNIKPWFDRMAARPSAAA